MDSIAEEISGHISGIITDKIYPAGDDLFVYVWSEDALGMG